YECLAMHESESSNGESHRPRQRSAHAHGKTPHHQRRRRGRRALRPRRRASSRSVGHATRLNQKNAVHEELSQAALSSHNERATRRTSWLKVLAKVRIPYPCHLQ